MGVSSPDALRTKPWKNGNLPNHIPKGYEFVTCPLSKLESELEPEQKPQPCLAATQA